MSPNCKAYLESDGKAHIYILKPDNGCFANLMGHSYINNRFVNNVASILYNRTMRVAWIEDRTDDLNKNEPESPRVMTTNLDIKNMFLINHSQKLYIDVKKYIKQVGYKFIDETIHPLPILTAVGIVKEESGYKGINIDLIGSWAYNLITIALKPPQYREQNIIFKD